MAIGGRTLFDERHYVPILRWKRGERGALHQLADADKQRLTPLIELPPSLFTLEYDAGDQYLRSMLIRAAGDIRKVWGPRPAFCDLGLMPPRAEAAGGRHPVSLLWEYARRQRLHLIPVTGLRRSPRYQSAVTRVIAEAGSGACIRLASEQLYSASFENDLSSLMASCGVQPETVDLVVDRRAVSENAWSIDATQGANKQEIKAAQVCGCRPPVRGMCRQRGLRGLARTQQDLRRPARQGCREGRRPTRRRRERRGLPVLRRSLRRDRRSCGGKGLPPEGVVAPREHCAGGCANFGRGTVSFRVGLRQRVTDDCANS